MLKVARIVLVYVLPAITLIAATALAWLYLDAHRSLADYFLARHGELTSVVIRESSQTGHQASEFMTIRSDSGLSVSARIIRRAGNNQRLPVLIVLGGHRTGSDAVDLFGDVGEQAVVALDYPYEGPEKARGLGQVLRAIPLARRAFIDTPPAVSLVVDWLVLQPWVDTGQIVIIGASLGVPFAALSAARDPRIGGAMLVHGAADNQVWLEAQVARRVDSRWMHRPLATLVHWLAYKPAFDTARNVALIAPRPVFIIGARNDERTPAGQTEALYAAAGEPKMLRWTEGQHIEPDRADIIAELLEIAADVLPLPARNDR
jgi:dienelactone hydrolase